MNYGPAFAGLKWTFSLQQGGEVFLCLKTRDQAISVQPSAFRFF